MASPSPSPSSILDAERAYIVYETSKATQEAQRINAVDKKTHTLWKTLWLAIILILLSMLIKAIAYVMHQKFIYQDFIDFIDDQRAAANNGYTGSSGLITALAIDSPLISYTFNNRAFPAALLLSFHDTSIRELYKTHDIATAIKDYADDNDNTTDARQLVCKGINAKFPELNVCQQDCDVSGSGASSPWMRYAMSATMQMTNGMAVGSMIAPGVGTAIGAVVGIGLGVAQTALGESQNDARCSEAKKGCNVAFLRVNC